MLRAAAPSSLSMGEEGLLAGHSLLNSPGASLGVGGADITTSRPRVSCDENTSGSESPSLFY